MKEKDYNLEIIRNISFLSVIIIHVANYYCRAFDKIPQNEYIFSLILVIKETLGIEPEAILNLLNPYTILGLLMGGAVIYWFSGASMQAVTTGAYRAVEYISNHIKLGECDDKKANEIPKT